MIRICAAPKRFIAAKTRCKRHHTWLKGSSLSRVNYAPVYSILPASVGYAAGMDTAVGCQRRLFNSNPNQIAVDSSHQLVPVQEMVPEDYRDSMSLTGPRLDSWYTGKHPSKCPGFVSDTSGEYVTSLPQVATVTTRSALQDYLDNTWCMTEILLGGLQSEAAFMAPPYHDLRHPMIFYLGHPAVLYVNKLRVAGVLKQGIDPYFEEIFETGVDEMSWDDLSKNKMRWPSVKEVHAYRQKVYVLLSDLISGLSDDELRGGGQKSPLWALFMGFEHERIHLETSSVLIAEMPLKYVSSPAYFPPNHSSAKVVVEADSTDREVPVEGKDFPINRYLDVPATPSVTLGKPASFPSYGFDNEYGDKTVSRVPTFAASQHLITNGDFLAFLQDSGYSKREYWSEQGWKWKSYRNSKFPTFWVKNGPTGLPHTYNLRLIFELVEMPWDWPVSVNLHEASAYAAWKTAKANSDATIGGEPLPLYRVMTEVEHHALRQHTAGRHGATPDPVLVYEGATMMSSCAVNTNMSLGSMCSVTANARDQDEFTDLFGNAWQWCLDYFSPLDNFDVHKLYEDFSTPCFDGLHHVIMGGSFISTGNLASKFARYHFRPHFFQHAGFRVVRQMHTPLNSVMAQQPDLSAHQYLLELQKQLNDPLVGATLHSQCNIVTSDENSPGPYVGSYPFRRTTQASESGPGGVQKGLVQDLNSKLSCQFGAVPMSMFGALATKMDGNYSPHSALCGIIQKAMESSGLPSVATEGARALVVGCGPGSLVFGLGQVDCVSTVIGIDFDSESIKVAGRLLQQASDTRDSEGSGGVHYSLKGEGICESRHFVDVQTREGVSLQFRHADPMCLPAELAGLDLVVLHDVLDTMASPNAILGRCAGVRGLVKRDGGLLVITSCYNWDANVTPKSLWLGGGDGGLSSFDVLRERLTGSKNGDEQGDYTLLSRQDFPELYLKAQKEVAGKVLDLSIWRRN